MKPGSIAGGLVLFGVGALIILRTVTKDDTGKNLVDKLLSLGSGSPAPPDLGAVNVNVPSSGTLHVPGLPPSVTQRKGRKHRPAPQNRAAAAGGY